MRVVMKFGGVCTSSGANMLRIASIVEKHLEMGYKIVLVISAMAGVTDTLISLIDEALAGNEEEISRLISNIRNRHIQACIEALGKSKLLEVSIKEVDEAIEELNTMLKVISYLKEASPRSRDRVLAFGEKMAAKIVWRVLQARGLRAKYMTGGEAGIITDDNFGQAQPIMPLCEEGIRRALTPLLNEGVIPVVTGFIGQTRDGIETTLGRGGSDYTATLIGAALSFDEVWVWKDVEGIMTADPKIVPSARPISRISYDEAAELAYFGAKVLHPLALSPLIAKKIPLRVRSFFNLEGAGTIVHHNVVEEGSIVKAVTMIPKVAIVTVSGAGLYEAPLIVAKVFNVLYSVGANAIMVSQSSSQTNISIVVAREKLGELLEKLREELPRSCDVVWEEDVCVIAVVGSGMRGRPGVAAKVFKAVAEEGVNVRMIAQGASELNISLVVKQTDAIKAVNAVHKSFLGC
ncbi:MAG: aspartate kinase [Thermoprotei archaeon]|nr:MAG: aspartate kinase [Thermoprotei archaeon]